MAVNKVILIGNVGKDPEIRTMTNGNEVASFSLATTDTWKDKQTGEKKDKTEWHRIVVFSQGLVGVIKQYVKKGSKLYLEGSLQTRKWTDNQGAEKYTTEIVLQGFGAIMQMLDSKGSGNSGSSFDDGYNKSLEASASKTTPTPDKKVEELVSDSNIDDEIPF